MNSKKIARYCAEKYKLKENKVRKFIRGNGGDNVVLLEDYKIEPSNNFVKVKKCSIKQMEQFLGVENTTPINPSSSDLKDKIEKGDCFATWYEEELRDMYEKYNS